MCVCACNIIQGLIVCTEMFQQILLFFWNKVVRPTFARQSPIGHKFLLRCNIVAMYFFSSKFCLFVSLSSAQSCCYFNNNNYHTNKKRKLEFFVLTESKAVWNIIRTCFCFVYQSRLHCHLASNRGFITIFPYGNASHFTRVIFGQLAKADTFGDFLSVDKFKHSVQESTRFSIRPFSQRHRR